MKAVLVAVVAASVVGAAKKAEGDISWEEAQCIMEDRKLIFVGDSNTRYWSYVFAVFLETGDLRDDDYEKCEARPRPLSAGSSVLGGAVRPTVTRRAQGATRARTTTRTGRATRGATGCGTASRRARGTR